MRAILLVNLLKNGMGTDQAKALASVLKKHPTLKSLCGNRGDETELNMSGKMEGAADAIMLVQEIIDNGALSKFIFGGDTYKQSYEYVTPEPTTLELGMTEADFSNTNLGVGGTIIISAWLTHKDKGAMTSLNLASNFINAEGAKHIAGALKVSKYVLAVILVPLHLRRKYGTHGRTHGYRGFTAVRSIFPPEVFHADLITTSTAGVCYYPQDMGALSSLNLSMNRLGGFYEYYDDGSGYGNFTATPEGKASQTAI
jgi:hypothetical protein